MNFQYREESISWICANQLRRTDITEEARKFLIGMQYEAEKVLKKLVKENLDQHSNIPNDLLSSARLRGRAAEPIAKANHISYGTVVKYAEYTRALEEVWHKVPELVPKILSGRFKISQKNLIELSLLNKEQIKRMASHIEQEQQTYVQYKQTRQEIQRRTARFDSERQALPSVKDMPSFDPDAEIAGLTLTIPSWSGSIDRIRKITNLSIVSSAAKGRLKDALLGLQTKIDEMLSAIKED